MSHEIETMFSVREKPWHYEYTKDATKIIQEAPTSAEDLEDFNKDQVFFLSDLLWWMNCEFIGETFCLGNFETGHLIYNSYMDCCYIFAWSDLDKLAEGKSVKLYAREVTDEDRELIERETK